MFKPQGWQGYAKLAYKIREFGPIRKARLQRKFEAKGDELVEKIKAATPVRKGNLRDSVRMVPKSKKPGVLIIAGGTPATTRATRKGKVYDEALLTEYGTRREQAEPFFWPTINGERNAVINDVAADMKSDED